MFLVDIAATTEYLRMVRIGVLARWQVCTSPSGTDGVTGRVFTADKTSAAREKMG